MKTDYCAYPPQIAADVEIAEHCDGDHPAFIIGSVTAGRFILLRETEHKVLRLIGGSVTPAAACDEFKRQNGGRLSLETLTRFLTKLDEIGVLAGERTQGYSPADRSLSTQFYVRFKLFNPDRLFARMVPALRWVWTPVFVICSLLLMLAALLLSLMNGAEVISYGLYVVHEHYLAVFIAGTLVVFSHEFAHGLTCKAFGGRTPELGVLLIYYFLPALYCNVSGIHLIPQRNRRLWVILAGVYWQVLVGTVALLAWFLLAPYTLFADLAFFFFLGSIIDVVFNANPLIKLDGYYFLSQWLRLPNLMDRSRAYWRSLLRQLLFGKQNVETTPSNKRERAIYAAFGLLSFLYTIGLACFIVWYVGAYLVDSFYLLGLMLAAGVVLLFARGPIGRLIAAAVSIIMPSLFRQHSEGEMATYAQTTRSSPWRRRLVPLAIVLAVAAVLLMPWTASVGSYGTLIAIPGQEAIIRAPESATLIELRTQPGDFIADGSIVGRLGNLELDEQIVQVESELVRVKAGYDRLLGELRVRGELAVRAEAQLRQRRHDYEEIDAEQRQINQYRLPESNSDTARVIAASFSPTAVPASNNLLDRAPASYPAAIAVLQADVELRRARVEESKTQLKRARQLFGDGILPRSELDTAEMHSSTLSIELDAARERLESALVDHRRRHTSIGTEMHLARSDLSAETQQVENLEGELRSTRALIDTLEQRRILLQRKRAQFELTTPRKGTVFGEELSRMRGHYFQKGEEICRIAETVRLLVRIQVPERQIGDVRVGYPVRLKTAAFPDRRFLGRVSKMGDESEPDQYSQRTYRVELIIENSDGLLRPGMTAFARIDFGRQMIGRILLHKAKQLLRPELWML